MVTMRRMAVVVWCVVFLANSVRAADPIDWGGVTEKHEMIPMRDGVKLSAFIYTPPGQGPWPLLLEQRYANGNDPGTQKSFAKLAQAGYVTVLANFRGSQKSEGAWRGYRALGWGELKDGYDLVEWLAAQPWSTGKVGTFGSSQAGFAQNFLAVTQPPHLAAQYMIDTGLSLYHEGYRIGGVTRPERFKGMDKVARVPEHNRELMAEWFAHPSYDAYWQDEDCSRHFDKMNVPCFTVGSWFDFMRRLGRQLRRQAASRRSQVARDAATAHRSVAAWPLQRDEQVERDDLSRECQVRDGWPHAEVVRSPLEGDRQRSHPGTDNPLLRDGSVGRRGCAGERMAHGHRLARRSEADADVLERR